MGASFLRRASSHDELWRQVDYRTLTVPEPFNLGVACLDDQDPDAVALTVVADDGSESYTFGEVKERSNRLANALRALGVGRGDVVGLVKPASLETAVAYTAIWRTGAIALPLSSLFGPDALAFRLRHADAKAVVTSAENAPKVREALGGAAGVAVVVGATVGVPPRNGPGLGRR